MRTITALLLSLMTTSALAYTNIAGSSQFNLAVTSVTALTVPGSANYARVCARVAEVEMTQDGTTPTVGPVGSALAPGSCIWLSGRPLMLSLKMIGAAGAKVDAEYFQ
jgi:hypothetical protein